MAPPPSNRPAVNPFGAPDLAPDPARPRSVSRPGHAFVVALNQAPALSPVWPPGSRVS